MRDSYAERKASRTAYYKKYIDGWKQVRCGACNGSGKYDHNGNPPCGACNGTGRTRVKPTNGKVEGRATT